MQTIPVYSGKATVIDMQAIFRWKMSVLLRNRMKGVVVKYFMLQMLLNNNILSFIRFWKGDQLLPLSECFNIDVF